MAGAAFTAVLCVTAAWYTGSLYLGGFTAAALSIGLVIFSLLHAPSAPLRLVLECRPLVWCGVISYGMYIWHMPVAGPSPRLGLSFWPLFGVRWAVTFAAAFASYWLMERPFLRLKSRFGRGEAALRRGCRRAAVAGAPREPGGIEG